MLKSVKKESDTETDCIQNGESFNLSGVSISHINGVDRKTPTINSHAKNLNYEDMNEPINNDMVINMEPEPFSPATSQGSKTSTIDLEENFIENSLCIEKSDSIDNGSLDRSMPTGMSLHRTTSQRSAYGCEGQNSMQTHHEALLPPTTPFQENNNGRAHLTMESAIKRSTTRAYKCRDHCSTIFETKEEMWLHKRQCISSKKRLDCSHCPFTTRLKHHFEYHLKQHYQVKPFKCDECNYACVNKSMLNSHMKSHNAAHRFLCADCRYSTKYQHLLEQHMERFQHFSKKDVSASSLKLETECHDSLSRLETDSMEIAAALALAQSLTDNMMERQSSAAYTPLDLSTVGRLRENLSPAQKRPKTSDKASKSLTPKATQPTDPRVRRGLTIEGIAVSLMSQAGAQPSKISGLFLECKTCGIAFRDRDLYEIHIGYHSIEDPLRCRCGFRAVDAVHFFTHLNQQAHPVSLTITSV